ncbi:MAG TPA: STAS domain-containing protein [Streptosporangiaceae bacterium]|nr:STAS domain-containing protein [Streptosporangiaceae bacterium]
MIDAKTEQVIIIAEGQDRRTAASLELSHRIEPSGEAVARIGGELDIATADAAVRYVTRVIDHHRGPVIVDLASLYFCDARGLAALVQMAGYAGRADHAFRVTSPSPMLLKLLRIATLDQTLLGTAAAPRAVTGADGGNSPRGPRG